jgi:hypothetical protein
MTVDRCVADLGYETLRLPIRVTVLRIAPKRGGNVVVRHLACWVLSTTILGMK